MGSVTPTRQQVVNSERAEFTITPAAGYQLASTSGCLGQLQNNRFITLPLFASCNLLVRFSSLSNRIPDTNLAAAIRAQLSLASGADITSADLLRLTELEAAGQGISSLTGLEEATQLRRLILTDNPITDLSPLSSLNRLSTLEAGYTSVRDASALSRLPLVSLNLNNTPLADLEFTRGMNSLRNLNIDSTDVLDLAPLLASGLGTNSSLRLGSSNNGCLYTSGYSRPLADMQQLRQRGVSLVFFDQKMRRQNCPNSLAGASRNLQAQLGADGQLRLQWRIQGGNTQGPWRCGLHGDLTLQLPREPLVRIEPCPTDGSLNYASGLGQPGKTLVIEDGLGGRWIDPLSIERLPEAGPAPDFYIDSIDFGQTLINSNPRLVASRDALIRIHAISRTPLSPAPSGTLLLSRNGSRLTLPLKPPTSLPTLLQFTRLDSSYSAVIPGDWIEPGLQLQVSLNGLNKILVPKVGAANHLYLTLVPVVGQGVSPQLENPETLERQLKTLWPLAQVSVQVREPVNLSFSSADDLLGQLIDLREQDAATSYYYGLVSPAAGNFNAGGIALIGGRTGVGLDAVHDPDSLTMAHELGHMFGLLHVNCGNPSSLQYDYPHNSRSTGSLGINYSFNSLLAPERYSDIMGYCRPQHVSDFSYQRAQDYLEENPPSPFASALSLRAGTAAAPQMRSLYLSGALTPSGQWRIRQLTPVPGEQRSAAPSDYQAWVIDERGARHSAPLHWLTLDHPELAEAQHFTASLPLVRAVHLEIWQGDQLRHSQAVP
jgi:Leucine-rich repeat (LRR) protein